MRVRDDAKSSAPVEKPPGLGRLPSDADDRELVARRCGPSCRSDRCSGTATATASLPEHDDLPAMLDFGRDEEAARAPASRSSPRPSSRSRRGCRSAAWSSRCRSRSRDWLLPVAPSQTSTSATDGHSRSIARASSIVRFGRRALRGSSCPTAKLSAPHFCTHDGVRARAG